jgi:hypothetical protein
MTAWVVVGMGYSNLIWLIEPFYMFRCYLKKGIKFLKRPKFVLLILQFVTHASQNIRIFAAYNHLST